MFSFQNLILCDEEHPHVKVRVWADVARGCLTISGQDFGRETEETWDEDEYEYFYSFDAQNTSRLYALLAETSSEPNIAFLARFSGINGCRAMREFCDMNGIIYEFHSC